MLMTHLLENDSLGNLVLGGRLFLLLLLHFYQLVFYSSDSLKEGLFRGVRGGWKCQACDLMEGLAALGGLKLP